MDGLPMCAELEMAVGSPKWLDMMVLYCRKAASEDWEVAFHFNRLRGDRVVGFKDRMAFVHELESVEGVSVAVKTDVFLKEMMEKEDKTNAGSHFLEGDALIKMAEFLKDTQDKDTDKLMKLQVLGRAFELRACEKKRFIKKLKDNMDY
ncbi:hypothetical protein Tco_1479505 [Tanacetum coccineum]